MSKCTLLGIFFVLFSNFIIKGSELERRLDFNVTIEAQNPKQAVDKFRDILRDQLECIDCIEENDKSCKIQCFYSNETTRSFMVRAINQRTNKLDEIIIQFHFKEI